MQEGTLKERAVKWMEEYYSSYLVIEAPFIAANHSCAACDGNKQTECKYASKGTPTKCPELPAELKAKRGRHPMPEEQRRFKTSVTIDRRAYNIAKDLNGNISKAIDEAMFFYNEHKPSVEVEVEEKDVSTY